MAAASKKPKLDAIEDSDFEGVLGKNEQMRCMDTLIYIVPKKISKARLQVLKDLSRKKGFPLTERFRYFDLETNSNNLVKTHRANGSKAFLFLSLFSREQSI